MLDILDPITLAIVGITIGVLGVIISVTVTMRARVRIEPCLRSNSRREVSKLSDSNRKIRVLFGKQIVDQVTTTRVWFFNRGRKPLKREDVPTNAPLILEFQEAGKEHHPTILDFRLVKSSKNTCRFTAARTSQPNQLLLDFDYLDYMDGAALEVQHDGSDYCEVVLKGEILGPKAKTSVLRGYTPPRLPTVARLRARYIKAVILLSLAIFAVSIVASHFGGFTSESISVKTLQRQLPFALMKGGVDSLQAAAIATEAVEHITGKGFVPDPLLFVPALILLAIICYLGAARRRIPDSLVEPLDMAPEGKSRNATSVKQ